MKQSVTEFSAEEIKSELEKARAKHSRMNNSVRIIFSPVCINKKNISRAASIYSRLNPAKYDTVVVVEEHEDDLNKKLSMPSNKEHQTRLGKVPVNDYLRNEFCDEDDDFFVNDSGFHKELSLFQQLMMLQSRLRNFKVLNIQISDRDQAIVKELASAVSELLASRNILLVFCCDLKESCGDDEIEKLNNLTETDSVTSLMNLLNRHSDCVNGISAFKAGMLIAHKWKANVHFLDDKKKVSSLAAYAERERVFY